MFSSSLNFKKSKSNKNGKNDACREEGTSFGRAPTTPTSNEVINEKKKKDAENRTTDEN